ncbi:unnamed protein product [Orchesella dallaii]|uniref:F-box domain-containing protein n=1 Tax=Orchesella dallaii TaxID=48710 RepID=A0ABP1PVW0_9HEXA
MAILVRTFLVKFPALRILDLINYNCENGIIAAKEPPPVDANNEDEIRRHDAQLDRDLMMTTWHDSIARRCPNVSREEAVCTKYLNLIPADDMTDLLNCRLVNKQWEKIIDKCLESRFIAGEMVPFPSLGYCKMNSILSRPRDLFATIPFNGLKISGNCQKTLHSPTCDEGEKTT